MPLGVATPLPYTSSTFVSGVSRRWHCITKTVPGFFSSRWLQDSSLSSAARSAPVMSFTGTRSPTPSALHHTWACTLSGVAAPLSASTKCWSSSTLRQVPGSTS